MELQSESNVVELDCQVIPAIVVWNEFRMLLCIDSSQGFYVLCIDILSDGKGQFPFVAIVRSIFEVFSTNAAIISVQYKFCSFYLFFVVTFPLWVGEGEHGLCLFHEVIQFLNLCQQIHLFFEFDGIFDVEEGISIFPNHYFIGELFFVILCQLYGIIVVGVISVTINKGERLDFTLIIFWIYHHGSDASIFPIYDYGESFFVAHWVGERDETIRKSVFDMFHCSMHGIVVIFITAMEF